LYLPFKEEKLKNVARENGLEPLAKIIMAQNKDDIDFLATKYLNDTVNNEDAALQGAEILLPNGLTKIFLFVNSCDACTREKQPLQQK
jgi:transcriptional accessory protein Tex/SPT6